MEQPTVVAALVSGAVALLVAILSALVAQRRATFDEKLVVLRAEIETAAAKTREATEQLLDQLRVKQEEDSNIRLKIAEARLPGYQRIWQCLMPVSPSDTTPLGPDIRSKLDRALREAFYLHGAGLLLSHAALSKYLLALDGLHNGSSPDAEVRKAFSALRTQMKADLSIYTDEEAARAVRHG